MEIISNCNEDFSFIKYFSNIGILVENEKQIIIAINDAFCRIFKIKKVPSELIGTKSELIVKEIKKILVEPYSFDSTINNLINNKQPVGEQKFEMVSDIVLEFDFVPIIVKNDYSGQLWSYKVIPSRHNIDKELLEAQLQAKASILAKDQFLSIISHELKTPMNAVIGFTQLLINNEPKEQQLEYLNSIKYSADNLIELINNILDHITIESGNIILEKKEFDIHQVLDSIEDIFKYQAEDKGLRFMIHKNHNVSQFLVGDSLRLNQILINLIGNAIKFTEKGFVEVLIYNSKVNSKNLIFEVRDSGIGVEDANQLKIFERFTQACSENTRKYGGVGLGLEISKKLVQLLGGTISLQSKIGQGSSFFVELPFDNSNNESILKNNSNTKEINKNLSGTKILIVEDNLLNQIVTQEVLKKWGVETVIAENGKVALEILNAGVRFNLILMDLQMPVMDGFTATQHIRNDYNGMFINLPIIALTAATSDDMKLKAKQAGVNDFISKPFESKVLYDVILNYLCVI